MQVVKIKTKPLFKWQIDTINLYDKHRQDSVIVIKSQRQVGKSYCLKILALKECINSYNRNVIIICPTYNICRKQFLEIEKTIKKLPVIKSINASYFEVQFTNGSILKFKSAESKDNLRGETAHLLIFDEASFINLDTAIECFAYTNVTQGTIIICSTPKFKDNNNFFYKYYRQAYLKKKGYYLIDYTKYDTSELLSEEKLQMYKETMPTNIFNCEILGNFIEINSSVFGEFSKVINNNQPFYNHTFVGIDFSTGVNNDETAICVFNEHKEMVALHHFNDKDSVETVGYIINLFIDYNVEKAVIETNSIGKVFLDLIKKEISKRNLKVQLIPFTTTNQSKREIIQNLQLLIQNESISLLDDMTLKLQLANFEIKSTPSGLITYGNSSDTIHDDTVIATALALHAFKVGGYAVR